MAKKAKATPADEPDGDECECGGTCKDCKAKAKGKGKKGLPAFLQKKIDPLSESRDQLNAIKEKYTAGP